jgi:hypothetical protein
LQCLQEHRSDFLQPGKTPSRRYPAQLSESGLSTAELLRQSFNPRGRGDFEAIRRTADRLSGTSDNRYPSRRFGDHSVQTKQIQGDRVIGRSACVIFALLLLGVQSATAQTCVVGVESYRLSFDNVIWSIRIGAGQSCIGGFRVSNVTLDTVRLVIPPESGQVTLHGPGFSYKAKSGFQGEDSFSVLVSGTLNRIRGSSTIRVVVSVVDVDGSQPPAPANPSAR